MSEKPDPLSERWPLAPATDADWVEELCSDGSTGFMPPAMPDAGWVLNAMYEHEQGPTGLTYHRDRHARLADGRAEPVMVNGVDLDAGTIVPGGGLGRARHPGAGWRRLRWTELAERTGDPVVPDGLFPCHRCFPTAKVEHSWPVSIIPPTEGSLDRETWDRLIGVLTEHSPSGPDTRCLAFYAPIPRWADDWAHRVRRGRLGDSDVLYEQSDIDFSPSDLWPEDRSWLLCTDYDLWATKVVGPTVLIDALLADAEIEALRLPWAH